MINTQEIMDSYLPRLSGKDLKTLKPRNEPDFQLLMYRCQIKMIEYYLFSMDRVTRVRAEKTLELIKQKVK